MDIAHKINNSIWALDSQTMASYAPRAVRLMQGEEVNLPQYQHPHTEFITFRSETNLPIIEDDYDKDEERPTEEPKEKFSGVVVYNIKGIITKEDGLCGQMGTEKLARLMQENDEDDRVMAHVLNIDSGGGEVRYTFTAADIIRNKIEKPVLGSFNGLCASGAYALGAAADELFAQEASDKVGSVGVMAKWQDIEGMLEEEGVVIHEVYADPSKLKNLISKQAKEGNYTFLKDEFLNPTAVRFQNLIKSFRPDISGDEWGKGKTFNAVNAESIGMIDGIKDFDKVLNTAYTRGIENELQKQNSNTMNDQTKNFIQSSVDFVSRIFGKEVNSMEEAQELIENEELPTEKLSESIESLEDQLSQLAQTVSEKIDQESLAGELDEMKSEIETSFNDFAEQMKEELNGSVSEKIEELNEAKEKFAKELSELKNSRDMIPQNSDEPVSELAKQADEYGGKVIIANEAEYE